MAEKFGEVSELASFWLSSVLFDLLVVDWNDAVECFHQFDGTTDEDRDILFA